MIAELNIFKALKQLESHKGKSYSVQDIAAISGLHRHTVSAMLEGREDKTLSKILAFFTAEGMPVQVADVFTLKAEQASGGE